jgi:hypothetical protein
MATPNDLDFRYQHKRQVPKYGKVRISKDQKIIKTNKMQITNFDLQNQEIKKPSVEIFNRFKALKSPMSNNTSIDNLPKAAAPNSPHTSKLQADEPANLVFNDPSI